MMSKDEKNPFISPSKNEPHGDAHLVVLHHGLLGAPIHVEAVIRTLRAIHPNTNLIFLNVDVSKGHLTYDGIDICGDRCVQLIHDKVEEVGAAHVTKVSLIGYSLGGLIIRYVAGKLFQQGFFDTIKPVNFITIASPHLGTIRNPSRRTSSFENWVIHNAFARVGEQFLLRDTYSIDNRVPLPLLVYMAYPKSVFFRALELFEKRSLFANSSNDFTVPFTTAAIEISNPYKKYAREQVYPETYPSIVTFNRARDVPTNDWTWTERLQVGLLLALSPVLFSLWLCVAPISLTIMSIRARRRLQHTSELVYDSSWLSSGSDQDSSDEEKLLSLNALTTSEKRTYIANSLNTLSWEKVHVYHRFTNAHRRIVDRNSKEKNGPSMVDTLLYLAEKVFIC